MPKLLQIILIVAFVIVPTLARAQDERSRVQRSILDVTGDTLRVRLLDAFSGQPIANAEIEVESDNGMRCSRAPCPPPNPKSWMGRSDVAGRVTIPRSAVQAVTYVSAALYQTGLLRDAIPGGSETWVLELFPQQLDKEGELGTRGYKLIDARTGKPIVNTAVRIEFPGTGSLDTKTNSLGYVFFPFEKALGVPDLGPAWVTARGYRRTQLDFEAGQRGTKLKTNAKVAR